MKVSRAELVEGLSPRVAAELEESCKAHGWVFDPENKSYAVPKMFRHPQPGRPWQRWMNPPPLSRKTRAAEASERRSLMECLIAYRMTNGEVGVISEDDGRPSVFSNLDRALAFAEMSPLLRSVPYQVIELDDI